MKKNFLSLIVVSFIYFASAQQDAKDKATKIDQFTSKTGTTVKIIDYEFPDLELNYGSAESKVRNLISGNEAKYFYIISKNTQYATKTAAIAYEDLIEILKALRKLKTETSADFALNPDYLENKFATVDGFQVGYYVSKGKLQWYLVLERYGSDNTVFLKDVSTIETAFTNAKNKIESLSKK